MAAHTMHSILSQWLRMRGRIESATANTIATALLEDWDIQFKEPA